jgi:hypothetical protein
MNKPQVHAGASMELSPNTRVLWMASPNRASEEYADRPYKHAFTMSGAPC